MERSKVFSVQLYNCSGRCNENFRTTNKDKLSFTKKKNPVAEFTPSLRCCCSRIFDRKIQSMRQARLQMCSRARARPQALSLHKSSQKPSGNVVRSERVVPEGSRILRQLWQGSRDSRGNQRNKRRTDSSSRGVLKNVMCDGVQHQSTGDPFCDNVGVLLTTGPGPDEKGEQR
jgi:hypothetical protein